jgi:hypothetical protein
VGIADVVEPIPRNQLILGSPSPVRTIRRSGREAPGTRPKRTLDAGVSVKSLIASVVPHLEVFTFVKRFATTFAGTLRVQRVRHLIDLLSLRYKRSWGGNAN